VKILFVLIAFALTTVLFSQWRNWPPQPPQVSATDPNASADETPEQLEENLLDLLTPLGEKEDYAQVTERPLFLPDRRPPVEEELEETPVQPEQIGDLDRMDLNAVMITSGESAAWVRDPSKNELLRLRPGDELVGWSVEEILSDRLLLERQGETDTLILRDYKNMPPPVTPRQKPTARKRPQQAPRQAAKGRPQEPDAERPNASRRPGPRNSRPRESPGHPGQQRPQNQR
jgi:general secretion pathway protein N